MLIVPIHEARPGQKLALGVMNPQVRDQELLKAGFVLDQPIIDRLESLGVIQIFVDFPGLDDLDPIIMAQLSPERQVIYQQVKSAIVDSEKSNSPVIRLGPYVETTRQFVKTIMGNPNNAMMLDVLNQSHDEVEHATTVAHLSLVIGLKLDAFLIRERSRLPAAVAKDVTPLGVAGMLHDIGKTRLPEPLRKYHTLNPPPPGDARELWEKHPQYGYEMIRNGTDATTAAAVLHHHQRFDGSGFPKISRGDSQIDMSGGQIHCFARILAVADLYDRLSRSQGPVRLTNYRVLHLLKTRYLSGLDPEIVSALPQVIPPFSPGRRVSLSDGSQGIVIGFNPYSPYQPTIKLLDPTTQTIQGPPLDLRQHPRLTITGLEGVPLTELEKNSP
ncbi:MAG: phosphohydrolase [Phycisphaerae bacterium]|nr:MAG: phosphohydrolase [Phycisphaerae bacterium]